MRKLVLGAFLVAGILAAATPAAAAGNANFILGVRALGDEWDPIDEQGVLGLNMDLGGASWPVQIEFGFHASGAEDDIGPLDVTASIAELQVGVQKFWKVGSTMRPFVGGGLALVWAEVELEDNLGFSVDEDDNTVGAYVHGGIYWRLGKAFNIGLDGRITGTGDLEAFGSEVDANYFQLGMILGFGWE